MGVPAKIIPKLQRLADYNNIRAVERHTPGIITVGILCAHWLSQQGGCCYCQAPLKIDAVTVEHLTPRWEGGVNRDSNTALACRSCNLARNECNLPDAPQLERAPKLTRKEYKKHLWAMQDCSKRLFPPLVQKKILRLIARLRGLIQSLPVAECAPATDS